MPNWLKWCLRGSIYLLVVACSQPLLESYGCACASRSYTAQELAGYRAGAAADDVAALAQMEEYHRWRKWQHEEGTPAYIFEERQERSYFDRRIALDDPEALDEEINELWRRIVFYEEEPAPITSLERARELVSRYSGTAYIVMDYRTLSNGPVRAAQLLDREISYARQQGDDYLTNLRTERGRRLAEDFNRIERQRRSFFPQPVAPGR